MLSKKEILEELENRKAQAANRACADVSQRMKAEQDRIIRDIQLIEFAAELDKTLSDALNKLNAFKKKAKERGCVVHEGYYGAIGTTLNGLIGHIEYKLKNQELSLTSRVYKDLESEASVLRSAVTSEWNKVIQNCQGLSKNKEVVKYLVSIGFNEADFNPECATTSLMVPVNTALLCREVVKNEMD